MNYRDYKRIMKERNLIENVITIEYLETAKALMNSIRYLKGYNSFDREVLAFHGVDIVGLYKELLEEKNKCIKKAIEEAWDKDETLETFGNRYYSLMAMAEKVTPSRFAELSEHFDRECKL